MTDDQAIEEVFPVKRHWFVRLEWKPQDCWFGVFWKRRDPYEFDLWVCLLPMVPLHVGWTTWEDPPATDRCPDETTCLNCGKRIVWAEYSYVHEHSGEADCRPLTRGTQAKPVEWADEEVA
jgi:hypothetical protein